MRGEEGGRGGGGGGGDRPAFAVQGHHCPTILQDLSQAAQGMAGLRQHAVWRGEARERGEGEGGVRGRQLVIGRCMPRMLQ